tara:strand:- start:26 stop:514 length:489 start_codon:yes stop_codon:yes gene_type:complete
MIRTINQCKRLYRNVKCNEDANVKCITYETASHNMNMDVNQKSFVMYFHNHTVTPNFTTEKIESVGEGSWFGKIKHNYWWGADSPLLTITVKNISEATKFENTQSKFAGLTIITVDTMNVYRLQPDNDGNVRLVRLMRSPGLPWLRGDIDILKLGALCNYAP